MSLEAGIGVLLLFFIIFTIVLLHELTHSLVAIKNGIKVSSITLLPIGGLAHVEIPEKPETELMISISGPLLNFCLAFIAWIALLLIVPNPTEIVLISIETMWDNIPSVIFNLPGILSVLVWINLMLGYFNILPGFPMDGGRVFRAVLALWMDYVKATHIAVRIGQVIFLGMIFAGLFLFPNLLLVIIGMFLFFASGSELSMAKVRHSLHNLSVGAIARKKISPVSEDMTIEKFLELIAKPEQNYYPVVNSEGKVRGILNAEDLASFPQQNLSQTSVKEVMQTSFQVIDAKEKIEEKLPHLLSQPFLLVVDEGHVIGYLTPEYVMNFAKFYGLQHR